MNHLNRWALLALSLAVVAPPRSAAAQGSASVTGRVVDSATALAVSGARVTLVGRPTGTATDRDGRYLLKGLAAGTVTIRVQRIGFAPADANITLQDGAMVTQDFTLTAAATVLSEVFMTGYGTSTRDELSVAV